MTITRLRVPFNRPTLVGRELEYIRAAIAAGHASGDGPFTRKCSAILEQGMGVQRVLLTPSCTHALELAALLLDIAPGDEFIVPSFTFTSTANAFVLRGARPIFIDIRPDTLNLDERQLDGLVTSRTRVVVPVHYAGVGCEMDEITRVASDRGLVVVEDNAHGLWGKYKGRMLGTFGRFAAQSFHETKNFSCGEGGALVISDANDADRAEIIREKGTDRSKFFRGQVDKYTWVDVGSSYVLSDLLAAFLLAQLEAGDDIQSRRRAVWNIYLNALRSWADQRSVGLPQVPDHCEQTYHMFYLVMPTLQHRDRFIAHLKDAGILSVFHYLPLHLSAMGRSFGGRPGMCPVTEDMSERLVRLPLYNDLTQAEQEHVIDRILQLNW